MILVSKKPNRLLKNTKVRFERSQLCLADQGYRSELLPRSQVLGGISSLLTLVQHLRFTKIFSYPGSNIPQF
ncbi:hypothetical protein CEN40_01025 [Fischerella thermalis CCMEE 5205]|nr:hypothetical protein CEN40_01025 [Fischerella thermalis CCMEE 5205]